MSTDADTILIEVEPSRLDAAASPDFKREMINRFADKPDRALLDLSAVEFIDSTGLGVLVSLLKLMGPSGRIAVVHARPAVQRLFQITKLDSLFAICETREQARQALRS
jgi:anti-sigma B factor antagonist